MAALGTKSISNGLKSELEKKLSKARRLAHRMEFRAVTVFRQIAAGINPMTQLGPEDVERILASGHREAFGHTQSMVYPSLSKLPPNPLILDVGTSQRRVHERAISLDLQPGADVAWHLMRGLPFQSNMFDLVLCTAVLEHVEEPELVVSEMFRVLKEGGRIHAAIPFLQPYHEAPGDYQRYTQAGIRRLFRDFNEERVGWSSGFGETFAWLAREWRQVALPELQCGILRDVFIDKWEELHTALVGLDQNERLHSDFARGLTVAGGIFFEGTKPKS